MSVNFTAEPQTVNLTAGGMKPQAGHIETLLKTPGAVDPASLDHIELGPFGVWVGEVK